MTDQEFCYCIEGEQIKTEKYDWSGFQCTNDACWGSSELYFQIKRKWRVQTDFSGYEYMFTNQRIMRDGKNEECLDRTFMKMRNGNSKGTFVEGFGFVNSKSSGPGKCEKNGCGYRIRCETCRQAGRLSVYDGESGSNCYSRGRQHEDGLRLLLPHLFL